MVDTMDETTTSTADITTDNEKTTTAVAVVTPAQYGPLDTGVKDPYHPWPFRWL